MSITAVNNLPVAINRESVSPYKVNLVEATLNRTLTCDYTEKLIVKKAYDRDVLDEKICKQYGVEMVEPHYAS